MDMEAVNLLYGIVGAVVGAIAVAVAFEAFGRARAPTGPAAKLTSAWKLSELQSPTIVARDLVDVEVPPGARVLVSGLCDPTLFATCEVRQVPPVTAEFAIDAGKQRAFLFLAGCQPGGLALVTSDADTLSRLRSDAQALWERAESYVERRAISDLAGRSGIVVETQGTAQEVLPFKDRHLIRLEDQGHIIGVVVERNPMELRGERIVVRGKLTRDRTGYASIQAVDIRRIR
jgi:hypothetical protein